MKFKDLIFILFSYILVGIPFFFLSSLFFSLSLFYILVMLIFIPIISLLWGMIIVGLSNLFYDERKFAKIWFFISLILFWVGPFFGMPFVFLFLILSLFSALRAFEYIIKYY